jgi:hypothetical protein
VTSKYDVVTSPRQITLRNPSPELTAKLKQLAEQAGESMNTVALRLLEQAAGIEQRRERFERFATFTEEEAAELDEAVAEQRRIDPELWNECS